jgi:two-component system NarL family sensor kinase
MPKPRPPSRRHPRTTSADALEQRNRELSILNAIAQALNREIELGQALQTTLYQVVELFRLHTGWIWLLDEQSDDFVLAASLHLPPVLADNPRLMEGWCYCQEIYESGDLDHAANVSIIRCTRLKGLTEGTEGLSHHASVPLYAHGKQLGILNVVSRDWRELTPDELRLLYTVGDLLSIAIERARLFANSARLGAVEERNRLAREIHDTLAQGLAATALQLETAEALLDAGATTDKVRTNVEQALRLTRKNLDEARRSVLDLRAAPLEGKSLAEALTALATEISAGAGVALTCDLTATPHPLPQRLEIGLYRIAQEALTNIARHANASAVCVQVEVSHPESSDGQLTLTVEDDGDGFDPAAVPPDRFGLIGIAERARLLGGAVRLASMPGEGTVLSVTVSLSVSRQP